MRTFVRSFWSSLGLALGLATVSTGAAETPASQSAFASSNRLTATLSGDLTIAVQWNNAVTPEGGNWLEYTTAQDDFVKLSAFTDPKTVSFVHRDLVPGTIFLYRLQPFFGRATAPVVITTGGAAVADLSLRDGPIDPPATGTAADSPPQVSIRAGGTFSQAAATDLTASLSSPTSVDLHWTDHANDEDGFLLEISTERDAGYEACALLPPNVTSFRKTNLAASRRYFFRVRAFFYGAASEPVSATTKPSRSGQH